MTRINTVSPVELCDQHLLAEWRELTRIPNSILSGKLYINNIPDKYTVRTNDNPSGGKGHVKFFCNKLIYLHRRYQQILIECYERNFKVSDNWPYSRDIFSKMGLMNDWEPDEEAIALNRERIAERMPKDARYGGELLV